MITVQDLGGPSAVARALRISAPTAHGWKRIPEHHCPALELWKQGDVTVEQMRPDISWHRVPDSNWPHPSGRPLIDVAPHTGATHG
ncbi:MAG: helix-turn-helix domain-containing protein [Pseudomonas sp.]|uniref:YdaS family helix-turn-helix protein n=1 Tax=Acidovorax sp. TaxID=1872122 RepID=UPI00391BBDB8|nr:helix-turn-helix domain-containing protein [Pseudomonas sp.]